MPASWRMEGGHWWSGWPGAHCLLCGQEDKREVGLADGFGFNAGGKVVPMPKEYDNGTCPVSDKDALFILRNMDIDIYPVEK